MAFFANIIQNSAKVCSLAASAKPCLIFPPLALYRGYKRRNAHLDSLAKESPTYLVDSAIPLANQTFKDITSEEILRELRAHLSLRHALLDRVIRARKLHHSRFFPMTLDYGEIMFYTSLFTNRGCD